MLELTNLIAVIVAAAASFALGGLWYSPWLFLKPWLADMGLTEEKPGHPGKVFGLAFFFSIIACFFMFSFIGVGNGAIAGMMFGVKVVVGFVFCSYGVNYQFASRSIRVLFIDGGYHTFQFALFGLILGIWPW
ncbi:DUF1761 domain-containing protein [Aliikangiella sp. IMCC44653]